MLMLHFELFRERIWLVGGPAPRGKEHQEYWPQILHELRVCSRLLEAMGCQILSPMYREALVLTELAILTIGQRGREY